MSKTGSDDYRYNYRCDALISAAVGVEGACANEGYALGCSGGGGDVGGSEGHGDDEGGLEELHCEEDGWRLRRIKVVWMRWYAVQRFLQPL